MEYCPFENEIMDFRRYKRRGNITVLDMVDSTNTYLKKLFFEEKASPGDVVVAKTQTNGRGRLGRSFSSKCDMGIYMSYLMNADGIASDTISEVTGWTAVAVRKAILNECGVKLGIKWVNDLVYGSKKLCGILTELSFNTKGRAIIIGVGINVNHKEEDFPEDIANTSSSIRLVTGEEINLSQLCVAVIKELDKISESFPVKKNEYLDEYRKACVIVGKKCRIIRGEAERTGTVVGIDEKFGLIIDFDGGLRETITNGDVSIRGFYGYI